MDVDFKRLFCLLTTCDRIKSSVCEKWMEAFVFISSKSSDLLGQSTHSKIVNVHFNKSVMK